MSEKGMVDPATLEAYADAMSKIHQGVQMNLAIGYTIKQVRDEKLYEADGLGSFKAWVETRCPYERSHTYRLIESVEVVQRLESAGQELPESLNSFRRLTALSKVDEKQLPKVVKRISKLPNPTDDKVKEITSAAAAEAAKKAKSAAAADADLQESYVDDQGNSVPDEFFPVWRSIDTHARLARKLDSLAEELGELGEVVRNPAVKNMCVTVRQLADGIRLETPTRIDGEDWLSLREVEG